MLNFLQLNSVMCCHQQKYPTQQFLSVSLTKETKNFAPWTELISICKIINFR